MKYRTTNRGRKLTSGSLMAGGRRHSDGPTWWKARTRSGQTVVDVSSGGRVERSRRARRTAARLRRPASEPDAGPAHFQTHRERRRKIQVHAGKCDFAAGERRRRPARFPSALDDPRSRAEEAVALSQELVDDLGTLSGQVVDFPGVLRLGEEMSHRFFARGFRLLHQVMICR